MKATKTFVATIAAAMLAASGAAITTGAAVADLPYSFTECEAYNSAQDICFVYEYDPLAEQYMLVEIYFVPRGGGETPPPDTID